MYDPATIDAEFRVQRAVVLGDSTSCAGFCNFVANVQQLRVYLAMLGGQVHVTMIHTPAYITPSNHQQAPTRER